MTVKQISVFLENTAGRLAEVTKILSDAGINLRAITIADTADFGILRLIVNDTGKALDVFERNGFTAKATDVIGVEVEDSPGGLHKVMQIFEEHKVNIEYLYATLERNKDRAVVIFKVDDIEHGLRIIKDHSLITVAGF
ncbi:MAG: ACT domain-containing protein [Spirochaetales bacterium]|nr:MAG: ACT domain-containing protein [Spirochaetales bacterium]